MTIQEIKKDLTGSLRPVTLCLLVRGKLVLLAMKKRGFGAGKWNGVGGKLNPGESIEQAAIRETQEEIRVTPLKLEKVGTLDFYFPPNPDWNQQMTVFLVREWEGNPTETEEMRPEWFSVKDLPLAAMWASDISWMPRVLAGEKVTGEYLFGEADQVLEFTIHGA